MTARTLAWIAGSIVAMLGLCAGPTAVLVAPGLGCTVASPAPSSTPAPVTTASSSATETASIGAGCDVIIGPAGWTQPVRGPIVSGFGERGGRLHAGVDLAVGKRTSIHAAASGIVRQATCNAHTSDGTAYPCDLDGSPLISGCGWYVDIGHADGIITRYCHMIVRPFVRVGQQVVAGQVIGLSGSSGHSSGPHVHFEVHQHGDSSSKGAVDPVPFMAAHGAPLGKP